jgi:Flp pilus assembly protein TadB
LAGFLVFAGLLMLVGLIVPAHKVFMLLSLAVVAMALLLVAASLWGRQRRGRNSKPD